jgi:FemAB-related protein (PEP-CTERM system-associated)
MSNNWLTLEEGEGLWDEALGQFPERSFSMLYGWRKVYEKALRLKTYYLMLQGEQGQVQGLCPLVYMKSPWIGRGTFLVSLPYMTRAGICVHDLEIRAVILKRLMEKARELKVGFVELRELAVIGHPSVFPCNQEHIQMVLELPEEWKEYEKEIAPRLRQVKKAQKDGLKVKRGRGEELLNAFYTVFSQRMKELVFPVYPKKYFQTILEVFPEQTELVLVYDQATPVGGMLLFTYNGVCSAPYVATLLKGSASHPNQLLYFSAIQQAWEEGCRVFDFCRSQVGSGTFTFKSQWKAKPRNLVYHYPVCRREDLVASVGQAQGSWTFHLAEKIWPRLPLPVTQWLGGKLIRQLVLA